MVVSGGQGETFALAGWVLLSAAIGLGFKHMTKKRFENLLKNFSISGKLLIPIKYRNCIFYSVS